MSWITAYLTTALVFFSLDFVWLAFVAKKFYFSRMNHLLAGKLNHAAAGGFYILYIAGIVYFAVSPALQAGNWHTATLNGALFGFFCYATYDMTNQATLKNWPVAVTVVDIAWGTSLTATAATLGFILTQSLT